MAIVTGSLRRADMQASGLGMPRVVFYLPTATVSGTLSPGRITPTEPVYAIPDSTGEWTTDLFPTDDMLDGVFYKMRLEWISPTGTVGAVMDFPDWDIRVPSGGGSLEDLAGGSGPGNAWANQRIVWSSLTAPLRPRRGTMWLLADPNNPTNSDVSHPSWEPGWLSGDLMEWN